jgi:hypothetical protein
MWSAMIVSGATCTVSAGTATATTLLTGLSSLLITRTRAIIVTVPSSTVVLIGISLISTDLPVSSAAHGASLGHNAMTHVARNAVLKDLIGSSFQKSELGSD